MASLYRENIRTLKGVGERRAGLFQKLGAPTVGALLRLYPQNLRGSEPSLHRAECAPAGTPCAVRACVTESPKGTRIRGGMTVYKAKADDGESEFALTFSTTPMW